MSAASISRWALMLGLTVSCAPVSFIDPDAATKAGLSLEEAEHLVVQDDPRTYLFVRVASNTSTAGTQIVAQAPEGDFQLPWTQARSRACGRSRCLAFTLAPGAPLIEQVTLHAPTLAHASSVAVGRTDLPGYALDARAVDRETTRVDILDPLQAHFETKAVTTGTASYAQAFLRGFEVHVAPGNCGGPPSPSSASWRGTAQLPARVSTTFSPRPEASACVWARPAQPAQGPPLGALSVPARADVQRFEFVYVPAVERTPIVFMPFFDLEIPNPARCEEAEGLVLSAVLEAATDVSARAGVPVLALPPLELAERDGVACRQPSQRSFDAAQVSAQVADAVEEAFGPDQQVRVVWLYAQNLDLGAPTGLEQSFARLQALWRSTTGHRSFLFTLAPNRIQDQLNADRHLAWLATEEPQFRASIAAILRDVWPFSSVLHAADTEIRLLQEPDANRFALYRLCSTSSRVTPLGRVTNMAGTLAPPPQGPGFRVALPTQELLPSSGISVPTVTVEWEGCAGLCDRAAPGGGGDEPWSERPGC